MPSPSTLLVYAVTAVIVLLVPGPAVLYIVSQSVRQGRRAAYLVYLGTRKLLGKDEQVAFEPRGEARAKRPARLFLQGILVNVLNPKLALFFLAFLPQFVDRSRGTVQLQVATFGIAFVLLGLCTDSSYAMVA